jgi:hypothetical protein
MTTTLDPKSLEIKLTIEGAFFATDSSGSRTFVYDITRGHHNLDTGYYVWLSHSIGVIRIDEHELRFINKRLSKIGLACNEISAGGQPNNYGGPYDRIFLVLHLREPSPPPETCGCFVCWHERNDV